MCSCVVSAHVVLLHGAVVGFLFVALLEQELGTLHPIDVHQFIARLGHRKVLHFALAEPVMKVK